MRMRLASCCRCQRHFTGPGRLQQRFHEPDTGGQERISTATLLRNACCCHLRAWFVVAVHFTAFCCHLLEAGALLLVNCATSPPCSPAPLCLLYISAAALLRHVVGSLCGCFLGISSPLNGSNGMCGMV